MRKSEQVIYQPPEFPGLTLMARVYRVYLDGTVGIKTIVRLDEDRIFGPAVNRSFDNPFGDRTFTKIRRVSRDHIKPFKPNRERS
jgi:hypothetical protein